MCVCVQNRVEGLLSLGCSAMDGEGACLAEGGGG